MRVLFICSGNGKTPNGLGSIVFNQLLSLRRNGVDIDFYPIKGKGIKQYLKNAFILRKRLKTEKYDVYHAHFSYSAYTSIIAGCKPLVVSLMGSDIQLTGLSMVILKVMTNLFVKRIIVKSKYMKNKTRMKAEIVPNGIYFDRFKDIPKEEARKKVGFKPDRKYVIWVSNPAREYDKRYSLACKAMELVQDPNIELHVVFGVPHEDIPTYMYAADALLLSSRYEGSPNVIKEALYCNLPIVSTDVGDVRERIEGCDGCWLVEDAQSMANAIEKAAYFGKTKGRESVLHLDDRIIADRLVEVYQKAISAKRQS